MNKTWKGGKCFLEICREFLFKLRKSPFLYRGSDFLQKIVEKENVVYRGEAPRVQVLRLEQLAQFSPRELHFRTNRARTAALNFHMTPLPNAFLDIKPAELGP